MRILSRYVLARFLTWFGITFTLFCGIAVCADLLTEFKRIQELGGEGVQPIVYLLMRLPALHFTYLVPIAAFTASLLTLGTASLGLEVIAAKAGGISPYSLMLPVLAGAAGLTLVTWVVNDTLVVRATHYIEQPEDGDAPEIVFRSGSFWYHKGRTIYNIRGIDRDAGTLFGVSVYERNGENRLVRSVHAARATVDGPEAWRLEGAIIRGFDPAQPAEAPSFSYLKDMTLTVQDDPELGALKVDPNWLSTADLRRYIETQESDGANPKALRAMLQQRLAAPLTVFLFALLAIPAAFQAERARTLSTPALLGMIPLLAFWFFNGIATMVSSRGLPGGEWAPWVVALAFLAFGLLRTRRVPA